MLALSAVSCTTNNNGNCDAQGGGNAVTCVQSTESSSAAGGQPLAPSVSASAAGVKSSSVPAGTPVSPQGGSAAPKNEYLSDQNPVDQDPGADTAYVKDGGYTANGVYYDHAVAMDGGCQNGDGGDMWADWNLDRSWDYLTGVVALSDDAITGSDISYAVYLDGRKAASGSVGIGQSVPIRLKVSGVFRVRLWMNDPMSPNDSCGFSSVPYLVWGNLTATT